MTNQEALKRDLLPDNKTREALWKQVTRRLDEALDTLPERSPMPSLDMSSIREHLERYDFSQPRSAEAVLEDVVDFLEQGMVHTQHPRYFGLFNPSPTFPSILADTITAALNPQLAVWTHAPVAVEIERHVVRTLGSWIGWEEDATFGHFTSGGAEANYTATLLALTRAEPAFADKGATSFAGRPFIYASEESHLAWFKIAHQTGIGRQAVRLVPTDGSGRMDADALRLMVDQDRSSGYVPVMVAATAGTTNAGMIDPLQPIREVANDYGLWYHVDAAWGGAICVSPMHRAMMSGIETSDSITLDAHKWLAVPMGAGVILCRDQEILGKTFGIETSYMPEGVAGLDPYSNSAQWSRRFMGFKLFLSLAVLGRDGYAAMIERSIELAMRLCGLLDQSEWRVVNNPSLATVCFVDQRSGTEPTAVAKHVVEAGEAWISAAHFEDRPVLRACITSHRTTEADLDRLLDALNAARAEI